MQETTGLKPTDPKDSFEEVYRTYYSGCLSFIHSTYPKLRDEEVEDICSEAMMKAFRSFKCYDSRKGTMTTWLFRIAVNTAKDYFDDKKKQPSATASILQPGDEDNSEGYESDVVDTDTKTPIEVILEEETQAKKDANIDKLNEVDKYIVLMRDTGKQYKEIAAELGLPETTCRTKFRRAIMKLRKMMEMSDEI